MKTYYLDVSVSLQRRDADMRVATQSIHVYASGQIEIGSLADAEVLLEKLKAFIAEQQLPSQQRP